MHTYRCWGSLLGWDLDYSWGLFSLAPCMWLWSPHSHRASWVTSSLQIFWSCYFYELGPESDVRRLRMLLRYLYPRSLWWADSITSGRRLTDDFFCRQETDYVFIWRRLLCSLFGLGSERGGSPINLWESLVILSFFLYKVSYWYSFWVSFFFTLGWTLYEYLVPCVNGMVVKVDSCWNVNFKLADIRSLLHSLTGNLSVGLLSLYFKLSWFVLYIWGWYLIYVNELLMEPLQGVPGTPALT